MKSTPQVSYDQRRLERLFDLWLECLYGPIMFWAKDEDRHVKERLRV